MMRLHELYRPRPVRCLELFEREGWRLKVYGIAYGRDLPRSELVATAKRIAASALPSPAVDASRYGVGFLGIHDGRGANFIFLCWWAHENELHHLVWSAPSDELQRFTEQAPGAPKACVWDLAVIGFEREAWLECVLANPSGPDLEGYLARRLDGAV